MLVLASSTITAQQEKLRKHQFSGFPHLLLQRMIMLRRLWPGTQETAASVGSEDVHRWNI